MNQNNDKLKLARRAYYKRWRANNKEKVKEYSKRFWEKQLLNEKKCQGEEVNHNE